MVLLQELYSCISVSTPNMGLHRDSWVTSSEVGLRISRFATYGNYAWQVLLWQELCVWCTSPSCVGCPCMNFEFDQDAEVTIGRVSATGTLVVDRTALQASHVYIAQVTALKQLVSKQYGRAQKSQDPKEVPVAAG